MVTTVRSGQDLEPLLTEEDHRAMWAAVDAAARGDAQACWEHLMEGLLVLQSLHHHQVRDIALLGDEAPGWMYSRWAVDQAFRYLLFTEDPRCDAAVRATMCVAGHLDHVLALEHDPVALKEYGTGIAASDWVCHQLATFELGGLRDFVADRALPGLLDRCDQVRDWVDAAMGAYVLEEGAGPVLVVHDLVQGRRLEVLNLGALADRGRDETVFGRLVPISEEPGLMFESRPLSVPEETAYLAAELVRSGDPWGWLDALQIAAEDGLVHAGFSCGQGTLYSSDIVPQSTYDEEPTPREEMPGRMRDLVDAGLDEYTANGVLVAEFALMAVTVSESSGPVVGPHVGSVLVDPRIHEAVQVHAVAPEHEEAWRVLAAHTSSVVRARCEALAEACSVPRAS